MADQDEKFLKIKQAYSDFEQHLKDTGIGLVYDTEKGIYGTTSIDNIFRFFKEIKLQDYSDFIDLGCGDGRVVLVASLFTKAAGIEFSKELIEAAIEIRDRLHLNCELIAADYMEHDISKYDIVFMNPDQEFKALETKLNTELKGPLFIYNELFAPNTLKKGRKYWYGQIPIIKYEKE
jgi:SAM-dependent methyltransferase